MSEETKLLWSGGVRQYSGALQTIDRLRGAHSFFGHRRISDVGLVTFDFTSQAGDLGEPDRETPQVGVVLGEPRKMMFDRVEAGGGEDSRLPHSPAEHLS